MHSRTEELVLSRPGSSFKGANFMHSLFWSGYFRGVFLKLSSTRAQSKKFISHPDPVQSRCVTTWKLLLNMKYLIETNIYEIIQIRKAIFMCNFKYSDF